MRRLVKKMTSMRLLVDDGNAAAADDDDIVLVQFLNRFIIGKSNSLVVCSTTRKGFAVLCPTQHPTQQA
jgi:hypothetical protein